MWQQKLITPDHPPNEFGGSCSTHTGDSITTPNGTHHHHHSHRDNTLHSNLIRISKKCSDVFKKYEIVQVIGTGSMGTVSIVRIRDDKIGGSAFDHHHHHYSFSRYLGSIGLFGTQVNKIFGRNKQQQQRQRSPIRNDSNHNNNATTSSSSAIIIEDRPKKTHEYLYALKTIQLERITSSYVEELCNEIDILRTLDHPNIIKALEVYDSTSQNSYNNNSSKNSLLLSSLQRYNSTCHKQTKQIYMILELCTGGDLFQRSPYMILEAARLIDKLLNAIHYMHSMNIVHRDLKYENVLFETTTMDSEIKIIDFGLSKKFTYGTKPDPMTERVGTM